jgi:hypothetical protein
LRRRDTGRVSAIARSLRCCGQGGFRPGHIRGYGHVKEHHLAEVRQRREKLLAAWRNPQPALSAA